MAAGIAIRARAEGDPAARGQDRPRPRKSRKGGRRLTAEAGPSTVAAFAPAKANLYLHVTGRRADGYHELDSLVAFAAIADRLLPPAAARLSLSPGGPSDAAAALKALAALWRLPPERTADAATGLGADVPVCLYGRPAWVGGIGERIAPAPGLPRAGILLANPRIALPTAAVFAARRGAFSPAGRFAPMPANARELAAALAPRRNDLTAAAIGLVPEIGAVLARLASLPGVLLARMSGSGATCFALFADRLAAERAGLALAAAMPGWWCAAGTLNPDGFEGAVGADRR